MTFEKANKLLNYMLEINDSIYTDIKKKPYTNEQVELEKALSIVTKWVCNNATIEINKIKKQ